jgi:hypothetical protein
MTYVPLEAITAMTRFPVQDTFPCRQKRREPLEANPISGMVMLSYAVSSTATTRE